MKTTALQSINVKIPYTLTPYTLAGIRANDLEGFVSRSPEKDPQLAKLIYFIDHVCPVLL
jgi:hypothetical protein